MAEKKTITGKQLERMFQNARRKLDNVNRQLESMNRAFAEVEGSIISLQEIKKANDDDILIPLGSGVYIDGKINNKDKVKQAVAGNVFVDYAVDDSIADLNKQKADIKESLEKMQKEQKKAMNNMINLNRIVSEARQQAGAAREKMKEEK